MVTGTKTYGFKGVKKIIRYSLNRKKRVPNRRCSVRAFDAFHQLNVKRNRITDALRFRFDFYLYFCRNGLGPPRVVFADVFIDPVKRGEITRGRRNSRCPSRNNRKTIHSYVKMDLQIGERFSQTVVTCDFDDTFLGRINVNNVGLTASGRQHAEN